MNKKAFKNHFQKLVNWSYKKKIYLLLKFLIIKLKKYIFVIWVDYNQKFQIIISSKNINMIKKKIN